MGIFGKNKQTFTYQMQMSEFEIGLSLNYSKSIDTWLRKNSRSATLTFKPFLKGDQNSRNPFIYGLDFSSLCPYR